MGRINMKPFNLEEYLETPSEERAKKCGEPITENRGVKVFDESREIYGVTEAFHSPSSIDIMEYLMHL